MEAKPGQKGGILNIKDMGLLTMENASFFVFRVAPAAYGGSQARGLIGATAANL